MPSASSHGDHIRVDLTRQRILIGPDDPLPRFNPRPKAVMVIPIYSDNEVSQYPTMLGSSPVASGASSIPVTRGEPRKHRRGLFRRASSYSPPSKKLSHSHRRDHSVPPTPVMTYDGPRDTHDATTHPVPSRGRSRPRHRLFGGDGTSYFNSHPTRYSQDKARPPGDPLASNPPGYQLQAMQGGAAGGSQYSYDRPPNDVLAPSNPNHQLLATQPNEQVGAGGVVGAPAPSHGHGRSSTHGYTPQNQHHSVIQSVLPMVNSFSHSTGHGQAIDDAIRAYYKILPPNPKWCASRCQGNKKAVCIGINYVGQRSELQGCANDARHMRDFIIKYYGFHPSNVLLLTDDDRRNVMPTREEIFRALQWLVSGAKRDDSLFLHYSGHGGQSEDASGREADDMDETIFPVDFDRAGDIIDDELYQAVVENLPAGCRLTAVFDSCHSGTVLDLPYLHSSHGRLRSMRHVSRRAVRRGVAPSADVICFSACKDDETSADTFQGGVAVGAMSYALIRSLKNNTNQTYEELLAHLREVLVPKYDQKAQISSSHVLDLSEKFML